MTERFNKYTQDWTQNNRHCSYSLFPVDFQLETHSQLIDLAVVMGTDFTSHFVKSLKPRLGKYLFLNSELLDFFVIGGIEGPLELIHKVENEAGWPRALMLISDPQFHTYGILLEDLFQEFA